jgi:hypothetical protein
MSTQPPAEKAAEIINNLPLSITKTGSVIPGSESAATAPALAVPSSVKTDAKYNNDVKAGRYIIILKDGVPIDSVPIRSGSKITTRYTGFTGFNGFNCFNGFAGNFNSLMVVRTRSNCRPGHFTQDDLKDLQSTCDVKFIEENGIAEIAI